MLNWIFVLSFLFCFQVSASSYSQNKKIDLNLQRIKLKDALVILERKGNFRLLYSEEDLPPDKDITLMQKDILVFDALSFLLKGTNLKFQSMEDDLIVIRPKNRAVADIVVRGIVTDEKGGGIPGVSIKLKETTAAATTDASGKYSIKVPDNGVLIFSYLGYNTQEVPVSNRPVINVKLQENSQALTEIVVVGYGTQKKAVVSGCSSIGKRFRTGQSTNRQFVQLFSRTLTWSNGFTIQWRTGG